MGAVRDLADRYTDEYLALDPDVATMIGMPGHDGELTDYSPEGWAERRGPRASHAGRARRCRGAGRRRRAGPPLRPPAARAPRGRARCGRGPRAGPVAEQHVVAGPGTSRRCSSSCPPRPSSTGSCWRHAWRPCLRPTSSTDAASTTAWHAGEMAAPRQVTTVVEQLAVWSGERDAPAFFVDLVERLPAAVPDPLRHQLEEAASGATEALATFRRYLVDEYGPQAEGTPDAVGADRYKVWARLLQRDRPRPDRRLRLRVGRVQAAARGDGGRGRAGAARRRRRRRPWPTSTRSARSSSRRWCSGSG